MEVRLSAGGGSGVTSRTPSGVQAIFDERRRVGDEHSGLCFWAPGVSLIRELAPFERIVALVSASPRGKGPNMGFPSTNTGVIHNMLWIAEDRRWISGIGVTRF